MTLPIQVDKEQRAEFCRAHHITKFAFFGSILTERFGPDSDIDVLVEFHPGHVPAFLDLAGREEELSEILGRKVDLRAPQDISRYFRDEVARTALVQ